MEEIVRAPCTDGSEIARALLAAAVTPLRLEIDHLAGYRRLSVVFKAFLCFSIFGLAA